MGNRFTQRAEIALNKSVAIAEQLGHSYVGTEHVLIAISEDETACATILLRKNGLTYSKLYDTVKEYCGIGKRSRLNSKDTTPRCRKIIENSYKNAKKFSAELIGTEHILLSLIEERESVAYKIMSKLTLDLTALRDDILTFIRATEKSISNKNPKPDASLPYLSKYAKNMTRLAKDGYFDPVVGRDSETERVIRILSRKTKNNPCLIGEAGVGKTAIVEGISIKIVNGDVPSHLIGKSIFSLNLTSMVAGAKYRGDFEERIKSLMDEVREHPEIILFIDEIHSIVGAGSAEGAIDAANIMKPELARGDIQIIGATTIKEYKKYIEKDSALERRFQPVMIEEPTKEETLEILNGLKSRYEEYHNVYIEDAAINAAVELSIRYINDRFLPDKAIDIIDESCACTSLNSREKCGKNLNIYDKLEQISNSDESLVEPIDFCSIKIAYKNELINELNDNCCKSDIPHVTVENIRTTVEEITGIKINDNTLLPSYLKDRFCSVVVGQDEAIDALVSNIVRSKTDISDPYKPRGIFLFMGESGVGKTELAYALADVLFNRDEALIRLDMSEYSEPYSTSKLVGSAPGYVGYDDTSTVFDKVRQNPYSIILLDEIEKAHPDVLSLFLQIFDYGMIKDSSGRKISFRNTYIIMTSNVGCKSDASPGFLSSADDFNIDELNKYFKQEFINRIFEIIKFKPLSIADLSSIAKIKLEDIKKRVMKHMITLTIDDAVYEEIAKMAKKRKMGARPIEKIISKLIEFPLANLIIENADLEGCTVNITVAKEKICVTKCCHQLQS